MIVTVGEVLVVMGSAESGPLPRGDAFKLSVAGAEPATTRSGGSPRALR
jgi:hypothetical protein